MNFLAKVTTPVSESTRSTRSQFEHHTASISESESEISDTSAPSYSLVTVTDNNSDIQSKDEDPEAISMDGDSQVCDTTNIPERAVVCGIILSISFIVSFL